MKRYKILLLVLLISIVACKQTIETKIPANTPTSAIVVTNTPSHTPSPISTGTSIPTVTPTVTPELVDPIDYIMNLEQGELSCDFPCWGGIGPDSSYQEALEILLPLEPYSTAKNDVWNNCFGSEVEMDDILFTAWICGKKEDQVDEIRIRYDTSWFQNKQFDFFSPAIVLEKYGQPENISIHLFHDNAFLYVYLVNVRYDELNTVVSYIGSVHSGQKETVLCPGTLSNEDQHGIWEYSIRVLSDYKYNANKKDSGDADTDGDSGWGIFLEELFEQQALYEALLFSADDPSYCLTIQKNQ